MWKTSSLNSILKSVCSVKYSEHILPIDCFGKPFGVALPRSITELRKEGLTTPKTFSAGYSEPQTRKVYLFLPICEKSNR